MPGQAHFSIQLVDPRTGKAILDTGGFVLVCQAGSPSLQSVLTKTGAAASNPVTINRGKIDFYTADSVTSVDLYGIGPKGEAIEITGITPSGEAAYGISRHRSGVYRLPFSIADATAATEKDTGLDFVTGVLINAAGIGIDVVTNESGKTINIGILSSESNGDADGFLAAISLATAGQVKGTLTNGSATIGALLVVQDSANAGDKVPESWKCDGVAKSLSYTLSSGTASAKGFMNLPFTILGSM